MDEIKARLVELIPRHPLREGLRVVCRREGGHQEEQGGGVRFLGTKTDPPKCKSRKGRQTMKDWLRIRLALRRLQKRFHVEGTTC